MTPAPANPYIVGGALGDAGGRGFFGREDIFKFVAESLNVTRRLPIVLYGQRRIGKSSVLRQLPHHLPPDLVCVYYDLQGKAELSLDQVLFGLGRAIAGALHMDPPERAETAESVFRSYLARAVRALNDDPRRLVLLFDEFDVVDAPTGPPAQASLIQYLGGLVAEDPRTGIILVVGRKTQELSGALFSAFLKDSLRKQIGRLGEDTLARLVREPASGVLSFSDAAVERIYRLAGGHPFASQVLCYAIWNRMMDASPQAAPLPATEGEHPPGPRAVGRGDVDASFAQAIEIGTLGLNWVYDGLDKPTHRLFLSALAGLAGPMALDAVSLGSIEAALFARRLVVDQADLRGAPNELGNWDVIQPAEAEYRFTVPMMGAWIRKERPLQDLEQQTSLFNPGAARSYELALASQQEGNHALAIELFRDALRENPAYIEALSGLAQSLRARGEDGDLDAALEAYQRILDLAPESPRNTYLEVLVEGIEAATSDVTRAIGLFERLRKLDSDGAYVKRAQRRLMQMAFIRRQFGGKEYLTDARRLYRLLGQVDKAAEAALVLRRIERGNWFTLAFFVALVLAFNPFGLFGAAWAGYLQMVCASLSGTFIGIAIALEEDGLLTLKRLNLPGLLLGLTLSLAFHRFFGGVWIGGILGFMGAGVYASFLSDRTVPPELQPPSPKRPQGPVTLREQIAGFLERSARAVRSGGPTPK